jgi:hypothetical protein
MSTRKTGDDAVRSNSSPKHRVRRGPRQDRVGDLVADLAPEGYRYVPNLPLGDGPTGAIVGPTGVFAIWTVDEPGRYRVGDDGRLMRGRQDAGHIVSRGGRAEFELRNVLQDAGVPMHVRSVAVVTRGRSGLMPLDLGDVVVVQPSELAFVMRWGPGRENYSPDEVERATVALTARPASSREVFDFALAEEQSLVMAGAVRPMTSEGTYQVPMSEATDPPLFATVREVVEPMTQHEAPASQSLPSDQWSDPTFEQGSFESLPESAAAPARLAPLVAAAAPPEPAAPKLIQAAVATKRNLSEAGYDLFRRSLSAAPRSDRATPLAEPTPLAFPDAPQEGSLPYETSDEQFTPAEPQHAAPLPAFDAPVAAPPGDQEGYRRYEMVVDDLSAAAGAPAHTAHADETYRSYEMTVDDDAYASASHDGYRSYETPADENAVGAPVTDAPPTPVPSNVHEFSSYETFATDGNDSRHAEPFDGMMAESPAGHEHAPVETIQEYGSPFAALQPPPQQQDPRSTAVFEPAFASNGLAPSFEPPTQAMAVPVPAPASVPASPSSEQGGGRGEHPDEELAPFFSDEYEEGPADRFPVDGTGTPHVEHAPIAPTKPVDYGQRLKDAATWSYHGRRTSSRRR